MLATCRIYSFSNPKFDYLQLKCYTCKKYRQRLYLCLDCVFIGCYYGKHIIHHQDKFGHNLAFDLNLKTVFCVSCRHYIYDTAVDQSLKRLDSDTSNSIHKDFPPIFCYWYVSPSAQLPLFLSPQRKKVSFKHYSDHFGLRGLVNLGNTCFMNTILQALIHTPVLRNYFLSDVHVCLMNDPVECLVCELCKLFQEFYSASVQPLVPAKILHLVWTNAKHLAGYEQQDAHEFFIASLDTLHRHFLGQEDLINNSKSSHSAKSSHVSCDCIIDKVFTGDLQSDVTCQKCFSISTTVDPFWDISLDLSDAKSKNSSFTSLEDCLTNFTLSEHLGSSAKIKCSICESYQESTKQLTLSKLPIVACFHLKRFEHQSFQNLKKITTFCSFPQELDMSPFLTKTKKCNNTSNMSSLTSTPDSSSNKYLLFAVVNHIGKIDSGHYACYINQHKNRWFHCNDHIITPASLSEVLKSEGYLLFYQKTYLQYHHHHFDSPLLNTSLTYIN